MASNKYNGPEDPLPNDGKQSPGEAVRDERPGAPVGDLRTGRNGPRRRLTARQTILFVTIGLAGVVLCIIVLAFFLYQVGYVDRFIAGRLIQSLAQYGIRMEIGELETEFYPHKVSMRDVAFHNAATGERIATAERIVAAIKIEDLFAFNLRRTIDLQEMEIVSPEIWVTVDEEGGTNFAGLEAPPPDPDRRLIFEYATAVISLRGGLIHLRDEARDLSGELRNVRGVVRPASAPQHPIVGLRSVELALSDSTITYNEETLGDIALTLKGHFNEQRALIDKMNLTSPAAQVAIQGSINEFNPVAYDLRLDSSVRLDQITNIFLQETALEGTAQFAGAIKGTGQSYRIEGRFESESLAVENTHVTNVEANTIFEGSSDDLRVTADVRAAAAQMDQFRFSNLALSNVTVEAHRGAITGAAQQATAGRLSGEGLRVDSLVATELRLVSEGGTQRITAERAAANLVVTEDARLNDLTASAVTAVIRDQVTQVDVGRIRIEGAQAGTSRVQNIQIAGVNINVRNGRIQGRSGDVNVGTVALGNGTLTGVRVLTPTFTVGPTGYRAAGRLNLDGGEFDEISMAQASSDLVVMDGTVRLQNFNAQALGGTVAGDLLVNTQGRSEIVAQFRNVDVGRLVSAASRRDMKLQGVATGELNLTFPGTNVQLATGVVRADVRGATVAAGEENMPVTGDLVVRAERGDFQIQRAELTVGATELTATGNFSPAGETNVQVEIATERAQELQELLATLNIAPGLDQQLDEYDVNLAGDLNFTGAVRGRLATPTIQGRISVEELRVGSEPVGALSANVTVSPEEFLVREGRLVESNGGGIQFTAAIPRVEGRRGELSATIDRYGAENLLAVVPGLRERLRTQPGGVSAELSGQVNIIGIPNQMQGSAQIRGGPGQIRGQPFESFTAHATFSGSQINLEEVTATLPTGRLAAHGQANIETGQFDVRARGENVGLDLLESLAGDRDLPPVTGTVDFTAQVSGKLTEAETYQVQIEGTGRDVTVAGRAAGQVALRGRTENGTLNLELTTGFLGQPQTVTAQIDLTKEQLPISVGANLTGADLAPLLAALLPARIDVDLSGRTTGTIRVEGNLLDEDGAFALSNLRGTATFSELRIGVEDVQLTAASPVAVRFDGNEVFVQQSRFTGPNTNVLFGGTIALNEAGRQNLMVDGQINLRVLNGLSPDTFFSGLANVDMKLTGTYAAPAVNGTLALTDATVSALVEDERLTISNIDGRIVLTPGRAQVSSLTGAFGGGTVSVTGGAQLRGLQPASFQLRLSATNVSIPYPNDFDTTADLNLSLEGSPEAQRLTGTVQLDRVAYTEPIELADLLEGAREESIEASGGGGAFGANIALDINVAGRDSLVVRNNLAEIVGGSVFLQVSGTLAEPLVSGRITARTGTVTFRGNQSYELQRAVIELQAQQDADPLVDIQATSEIRGYQVTVTLTGPLSEPRLILRSDPALPVGDVVSLITTGDLSSGVTTASTLAQSSLGTAASLLTETFVNQPIQRATGELFGLNRFEIDPLVSGVGGTRPTVRISAGRQFNRNVSVIYATNVTGEPNQTVTVEYRISDRLFFVAQYEQGSTENLTTAGDNFGFEIRYRRRFSLRSLPAPATSQPDVAAQPQPQPDIAPPAPAGPAIDVQVLGYELSDDEERELLPPVREQTAELSAIVEGARRLRNRLQEEGYFFAEITPRCSVAGRPSPPTTSDVTASCEGLIPEELSGRTVTITYAVEQNRRYDLTDVRIEGTDKISYESLENELRTRENSALGFLPFVSDRGYTSELALERDRRTIIARMRELGYRRADVSVRRGVSVNGEELIITFVVSQGPLTRIADYTIRGNTLYTAERLRDVAGGLAGEALSRAEARAGATKLLAFYRNNGYFDVDVEYSIVDLPQVDGDERVRIIYEVRERQKVFIRNVRLNGNVITQRDAILKVAALSPGEVLRTDDLVEAERSLYATDAFRQVIVRTENAGVTPDGFGRRDVVIDVEELKPYIAELGFGYSTDRGVQGSVAVRSDNLFGTLQQGAARLRLSPRLQLAHLEYQRPRWLPYGQNRFAPLAVSVQYKRDTNVTSFFRSVLDRGESGIVQRFDEEGRPIDQFGQPAGAPSINRFLFNVETQRDFMRELGPQGRVLRRSTLYLRYNYEDVRLFNIDSLLLAPLLRPDRVVRLSRLGATFVRDTRESQLNASSGDFLSLDYALALRQLGGNISSQKFLANYYRFYTVGALRKTVLAANMTLGLANIFAARDRNGNGVIDDVDRTLPISERFFAGGANSLRGFGFEEAGPRVVIPGGMFHDQQGNPVTLAPFAVPVGGNALAVFNLEARVPVRDNFQVVPFYDGGNVFRNFKDIFGSPSAADPNLNARWTNTLGLGLRITTPVGPVGVDFGYLLDPPEFLIPQASGPPAIFRPKPFQIHIRFGQAF